MTEPYLDVSTVTVVADPTGLAAGDYYGRLQVSGAAANTPQMVTILLTVLPSGSNPAPEVRPGALVFAGPLGSNPGSQDVLVSNPTTHANSFVAGSIGNGFDQAPASATVVPGHPIDVRVFPDFTKATPGVIDRATLALQFSDGTVRAVPIMIVVAPSGCVSHNLEIQWRSPQPSFTAVAGRPLTLELQVADDCGNPLGPSNLPASSVLVIFSNSDTPIQLTHIRQRHLDRNLAARESVARPGNHNRRRTLDASVNKPGRPTSSPRWSELNWYSAYRNRGRSSERCEFGEWSPDLPWRADHHLRV